MGHFDGLGVISEGQVFEALARAARECGLGEIEIKKTFASGFRKGRGEPKPMPLDRPKADAQERGT